MIEQKQLERVTVNLVPRASAALELAVQITGDSKTDTINRALQLYAYLMKRIHQDKGVLVVKTPVDGVLGKFLEGEEHITIL